jgi:precorrin-6Y C5,15-methyltransferase (decarboxylating)
MHGKKSEADLLGLVRKVRYHAKAFVLLSGLDDVSEIAARLVNESICCRLILGIHLSYENEKILELSVSEAAAYGQEAEPGEDGRPADRSTGPATLLIVNEAPDSRLLIPVKKDEDLIRDNVPMTKACIRHESIIRLNLREGDRFYDIGGGTGSVAIEAASLHESLQVTTIEKKKEAADLIRRNVENTGLGNVTVMEGNAEEVLPALSKPDCVFIGGSGGKLKEIMEILRAKGSGIRCVITAVSMETISEVQALLDTYTLTDVETLVLQVSDVQKAGTHHMLKAQNPVWIFAFTM